MSNNNRNEVIEQLAAEFAAGNMSRFRALYREYRDEFVRFAHRYTRDETLIADCYHDAFITLYENIVGGKLVALSSSMKTYVFSIGKYTLFNKLRRQGREIAETEGLGDLPADSADDEDGSEHRLALVRHHLDQLGEQCRRILILFYYRQMSIKAIVQEMNYKNENTAKAHKSRCLKTLKERMKQPG